MKKTAGFLFFLLAFSFIITPLFAESLPSFPLDISKVNSFDRAFMQPYNGLLDDTATIVELGMLAAPGAFLLVPGADWFSDGLMYAETGIITFGTRYLLKKAFARPRPCMYYGTYPQELIDEEDWNRSLPSGHTAMCFMSASFVTYMFNTRYPDSKWKVPSICAAYGIAAATGAMRVASGNHFVTDVLAGAALGTVTGFCVPWIHDQVRNLIGNDEAHDSSKPSVSAFISPCSFGFNINF